MNEMVTYTRWPKWPIVPVVMLLSAVLLSFIFFAMVRRWESELLFTNFQWRAGTHAAAIQRQLDLALDGVDAMGAVIAVANVERVVSLKVLANTFFRPHRAIVGFAWVPIVPAGTRGDSSSDTATTDRLFSRGCGGIQGVIAPIVYLYPKLPGKKLDLRGNALLSPTVEAAGRDRRILVSPPFSWDAERPRHVIAVSPVFRDVAKGQDRIGTLCGYAIGILDPGVLVERALAPYPIAGIDVALYDAPLSYSGQRLYFHESRGTGYAGKKPQAKDGAIALSTVEWLELPGRRWNVHLVATPFFYHKFVLWRANAVLTAGLLYSAILGGYFVVRRRYERDFRRINRSLQKEVEERRRVEAAVRYQARHDPLTGLANRVLFMELTDVALARTVRTHQQAAFLFIDIDGFKEVNDHYGHDAGDRVLRKIADRLRGSVRNADVVARVGGDEFVALLVDVRDSQAAAGVARMVLAEAARPVRVDEHAELAITASIGIAIYPQDGAEKEILLRQADAAMYAAKQAGKNQFTFWSGKPPDS